MKQAQLTHTFLIMGKIYIKNNVVFIRGVLDEVLQVHRRVLPGCNEEGNTWLLCENVNGIFNRMCGNNKLSKAKDLINKLGADILAYNKHSQNLQHLDNCNGWNQLFKGGEADV
jgi:hypothetical protein